MKRKILIQILTSIPSSCYNRKEKSQAYNSCPLFALKIDFNPYLEFE